MFLFKSKLNIYLRILETPTALLRRRRVAILILGSVLLGAVLGRFFKVLVLVPACALVLAVVLVRSADGEHGLLRALLEFAVLITSLQIGYVVGLVSHSIPSVSERRGTTAAPPATRPVRGLFVFHPHPSSRVAPRAAAARPSTARESSRCDIAKADAQQ
jgi:hypothetical protein